ncbi:hypothetical protein OGV25_21175 [Pseudomonas sp. P1B16]|uniref:Uncharacterized protein n=2 Tax=Pseudomonas TaxID=286 RepID=A0A6G6ISM8_PSENT|nr:MULTISPECIES: hypothetical protein [Pseudomonas]KYO75183.1 hypothetical protein LT18_06178 [Pseudomonas aeruginosa]NWD83117.1 hypothetical protein [Pseudomonas reactans]NWE92360.1 hypothetical protein [Pseudomonas reactans]QIE86059.1 hypothetical protein G5B91_07180 [Pseudomonas nitroreducens]WPM25676.1 hypothetical protein OGV25_21175 [Pseudomonas sp. P1B16]
MNSQRHNGSSRTTLFPIGALVFSAGIDRLMREGRLDPLPFFQRHASGDWGNVTDAQWQANNAALQSGDRLESFYVVHRELSIRIVTEADRHATHVVLASER